MAKKTSGRWEVDPQKMGDGILAIKRWVIGGCPQNKCDIGGWPQKPMGGWPKIINGRWEIGPQKQMGDGILAKKQWVMDKTSVILEVGPQTSVRWEIETAAITHRH